MGISKLTSRNDLYARIRYQRTAPVLPQRSALEPIHRFKKQNKWIGQVNFWSYSYTKRIQTELVGQFTRHPVTIKLTRQQCMDLKIPL